MVSNCQFISLLLFAVNCLLENLIISDKVPVECRGGAIMPFLAVTYSNPNDTQQHVPLIYVVV